MAREETVSGKSVTALEMKSEIYIYYYPWIQLQMDLTSKCIKVIWQNNGMLHYYLYDIGD